MTNRTDWPSCGDCTFFLPGHFDKKELQIKHGKCQRILFKGSPMYINMAREGSTGDNDDHCDYTARLFVRRAFAPGEYDFERFPPPPGSWQQTDLV